MNVSVSVSVSVSFQFLDSAKKSVITDQGHIRQVKRFIGQASSSRSGPRLFFKAVVCFHMKLVGVPVNYFPILIKENIRDIWPVSLLLETTKYYEKNIKINYFIMLFDFVVDNIKEN